MAKKNKLPESIKKMAQTMVALVGISGASGISAHPKNIDPERQATHLVGDKNNLRNSVRHNHPNSEPRVGHFPEGSNPYPELKKEAEEKYQNERLREFFKKTTAIYDSWRVNNARLEGMQEQRDNGDVKNMRREIDKINFARAFESVGRAVKIDESERDLTWKKHQKETKSGQANGVVEIYNELLADKKDERKDLVGGIEAHQMGKFADGINQYVGKNIKNVLAPQDHTLWEVKAANAKNKNTILERVADEFSSLSANIKRRSNIIGDDSYEQGLQLGVDRLKLDFYKSVYDTVKGLDANGPQIEKANEMTSGIKRARDTIELGAAVGYKHIPLTVEFPEGKGDELSQKENIEQHVGGRFFAEAKDSVDRAVNRAVADDVALGAREEGWRKAFQGALSKEYDRQKTEIDEGGLSRTEHNLATSKLDVYKALNDVLSRDDLTLGQMAKAKEIFDGVGVAKDTKERDAALKVDNFYSKMEGRARSVGGASMGR